MKLAPLGEAEGEVWEPVGLGLAGPFELPPMTAEPATPMVTRMTTPRTSMPTRWATLTGPPGGLKKLLTKPLLGGGGGGGGAAALGLGFGLGAAGGAGAGASAARAAGTEAATAPGAPPAGSAGG